MAKAPEFAAGWSSLSLTYEVSFWYTPHMTPAFSAELLAGETAAAERAAALEPDAAATEHALGNVARAQFKFAEAERHYLRAMQIDPATLMCARITRNSSTRSVAWRIRRGRRASW